MITKIVVKGTSGYGPADMAFKDKVTVTESSIAYDYTPIFPSDKHIAQKWIYRTDSPIFRKLYYDAVSTIPAVLEIEEPLVCDISGTEFVISYDDGSKVKKEYWLPSDMFDETFCILKKLIPSCEQIPEVLKTGEDFDDD